MFAEVLKFRLPLISLALPPLAVVLFFAVNGWNWRAGITVSERDAGAGISVEEMQKTLAQDRQTLRAYEREQATLRAEVIKRRKL
ncbi:MAG: hypothetical protein ACREP5_10335, partial [Candidatus Binatia bacterium]